MDTAFPDIYWVRLQRETFDRLYAYRARRALPSWEETIEALLDEEDPWTR